MKLLSTLQNIVTLSLVFAFSWAHPSIAETKNYETEEAARLNNGIADYHQFEAQIVRVIDADTIRVRAFLLPGLTYEVNVRAKGVDAPELRGDCDWEKVLAREAKEAVVRAFPVDQWVFIENVELDSFGGRIAADIIHWYGNQRWRSLADFLMEKEGRWAVAYQQPGFDWCATIDYYDVNSTE